MNQQACLYVKSFGQLKDIYLKDKEILLNFSNKFRSFIFIMEEQFSDENIFLEQLNENMVLDLNEILTQFLTHNLELNITINDPIIVQNKTKHWIQDLDIFISFPDHIEPIIKNFSHHIYFYKNIEEVIGK